jgi:hypothetical protein
MCTEQQADGRYDEVLWAKRQNGGSSVTPINYNLCGSRTLTWVHTGEVQGIERLGPVTDSQKWYRIGPIVNA